MNFIENLTLETEQEKDIPPTPIKEEEGVILTKKNIVEIMNQARFPKNYMEYSFQFDDGNHPGWDTEHRTPSTIPNNFDISYKYICKRLPWIIKYVNLLKEHLLLLQKDIWNEDLINFSREKWIAEKINESALEICKLLSKDTHLWENPAIRSISHNIKNIFGNIVWYLDLFNNLDADTVEEEMELKLRIIDILLPTISKAYLFCTSSIEHLESWIQLVPIHFYKYWEEVEDSYKKECGRHDITLLVDLQIDFITDDFTLRSVIEDLFSNALKYTPQGGIIAIRANSIYNNRDIEIHLFNSWSAIPSEKDPFNVDQSTLWERNWIGTGVWLKGVQQLLANTESKISYKNTTHDFPHHPGCEGVEFTFTLPFSSLQEREQNK